jgi:hypothetical protein
LILLSFIRVPPSVCLPNFASTPNDRHLTFRQMHQNAPAT